MRHLQLMLWSVVLAMAPLSVVAQETQFSENKPPESSGEGPPEREPERPGPVDPEPETRTTSPEEPQPEEVYETREKEEENAEPSRIYKTRDRHGNIMFTDDPQGGGEEVRMRRSNSLPMGVPEQATEAPENLEDQSKKPLDYEITIGSPSPEQNFQNPGGPIPVSVSVAPELAKGHRLVVKYDGVALEKPEIPWPQDRGAHTISAEVVDEQGNVLEASDARTIYVHRASKLLPPNR